MAYVSAPSPVPGSSGDTPQTIGPVTMAGARTASASKNWRMMSAALRRLHLNKVPTPLPCLANTFLPMVANALGGPGHPFLPGVAHGGGAVGVPDPNPPRR